jgi:hypothetical protein
MSPKPRSEDNRLLPLQRKAIYVITAALWLTGLQWWLLDRWGEVDGAFGPAKNPLQRPTLVLHGCLALGYLLLLGSLITVHIRRGWAVPRHRLQASVLLGAQILLIATAAGLYYVGHETARSWISIAHLAIGLSLAVLLPLHVVLARRSHPRGTGKKGFSRKRVVARTRITAEAPPPPPVLHRITVAGEPTKH